MFLLSGNTGVLYNDRSMKRALPVLLVVLFLGALVAYIARPAPVSPEQNRSGEPVSVQSPGLPSGTPGTESSDGSDSGRAPIRKESLFVPYWNLTGTPDRKYERLIYFGISATRNGIDEDDQGFTGLDAFDTFAGDAEKWLTLRMLDYDENAAILDDRTSWATIANETAALAEERGYTGVVLDLETGLAAFGVSPESINGFARALRKETDARGLDLAIAVYGDAAFRKRPFDVKTLGDIADEIMVMAYDFHKSFGLPGPNFPLGGRDEYRYDFRTMVEDYREAVPPERLTVIFGMYGYQWVVDDQGRPVKAAVAVTLKDAQRDFGANCDERNCVVTRDKTSAETKVTYTDGEGKDRVVWYEDEKSVLRKREYLESQGIGSVSYWVYGYF
jgi:hypothetical protein